MVLGCTMCGGELLGLCSVGCVVGGGAELLVWDLGVWFSTPDWFEGKCWEVPCEEGPLLHLGADGLLVK